MDNADTKVLELQDEIAERLSKARGICALAGLVAGSPTRFPTIPCPMRCGR